jgi:hypothetical protein
MWLTEDVPLGDTDPIQGLLAIQQWCVAANAPVNSQKPEQRPNGPGKANGTGGKARKRVTKPTDENAKPRGRPRKHPDAKCKKALKQFTDLYAESSDATGAWNRVADNLDFGSGEAARKACERYQQAKNAGQNGQK